MPNQSHSGLHGIPWLRCQRCGYDFPESQLTRQKGLIVCLAKCYDNTDNESREAIISQVLQSSDEEPRLANLLKETTQDDDFLNGFFF